MRFFVFLIGMLLFCPAQKLRAQRTESGPIIDGFGKVFSVPDADLILSADKSYKVLFDIYTDPGGKAEINPLLSTVARFLNMHGQTGLEQDRMNIAVVLHGAGLKNALSDEVYRKKFGRDNPNAGLLKALNKAGVELFVCGQSMHSRGYSKDDLAEPIKISLSAMTALVHFQEEGYRLINFN